MHILWALIAENDAKCAVTWFVAVITRTKRYFHNNNNNNNKTETSTPLCAHKAYNPHTYLTTRNAQRAWDVTTYGYVQATH
jgi:hypothetical protein